MVYVVLPTIYDYIADMFQSPVFWCIVFGSAFLVVLASRRYRRKKGWN